MTDTTLRVGFVGAGNNTRRRHIPGFQKQPDVDLVAVANRTKESGERVVKEFGVARVYADWRDLLPAPGVDAGSGRTRPPMPRAITPPPPAHRQHRPYAARTALH